jgi:hypothetical protein
MDKTYQKIARYISDHKDDPAKDMDFDMVKKYALLGKSKVDREAQIAEIDKIISDNLAEDSNNRTEDFRGDLSEAVSELRDKQRDLEAQNDRNFTTSGQVGERLSLKQKDIEQSLLDLSEEYKGITKKHDDFLARQMERIKEGEKDIARKFAGIAPDVSEKLENISTHFNKIKNELLDNISLATEKPPAPETEQILIEETGQVITIEKR